MELPGGSRSVALPPGGVTKGDGDRPILFFNDTPVGTSRSFFLSPAPQDASSSCFQNTMGRAAHQTAFMSLRAAEVRPLALRVLTRGHRSAPRRESHVPWACTAPQARSWRNALRGWRASIVVLWGPMGAPIVESFLSQSPDEKQLPCVLAGWLVFYCHRDARTLTAHFCRECSCSFRCCGFICSFVLSLSLANKGQHTCHPLGSWRAQTPCHLSPWRRAFGTAQPLGRQPFQQLWARLVWKGFCCQM